MDDDDDEVGVVIPEGTAPFMLYAWTEKNVNNAEGNIPVGIHSCEMGHYLVYLSNNSPVNRAEDNMFQK